MHECTSYTGNHVELLKKLGLRPVQFSSLLFRNARAFPPSKFFDMMLFAHPCVNITIAKCNFSWFVTMWQQ